MAQRRRERNVLVPEGGAEEALEEEKTASAGGEENVGGEDAVRGVGEVPVSPGGQRTLEEGEGGASNKLRTVMEVDGDDMDEGEVTEADKEDAEG